VDHPQRDQRGGAAVSCCDGGFVSNSGGGAAPSVLDDVTLFEVADFSVGQPVGEIVDGSTVALVDVDRGRSLDFEFNRNGATSWAIGAVDGLRLVGDGATATAFNSGTFDSNWLRVQMGDLYDAGNAGGAWGTDLELDATLVYTIEAYFDLLTMAAGLPGVAAVGWGLAGAPSNSAARMQGVARGFRGAVQTSFGKFDATEGTNYTGAFGSANVLCATIASAASAGAGLVGVRASVAAEWPLYRAVVNNYGRTAGTATTTMLDENAYLAIGQWSGNAAGAVYVTQLRSMRIRAWR
jgi:hypothetical protein